MSHLLRFSKAARDDIERLYRFLAEQHIPSANAAMAALEKAWDVLRDFPYTCRKVDPTNPFLRELLIPFGGAGYVVLFEIEDQHTITLLAVRHQREDDYH